MCFSALVLSVLLVAIILPILFFLGSFFSPALGTILFLAIFWMMLVGEQRFSCFDKRPEANVSRCSLLTLGLATFALHALLAYGCYGQLTHTHIFFGVGISQLAIIVAGFFAALIPTRQTA